MILIDLQIYVLAASLLIVPVLAIITLRQSKRARAQHQAGWKAARPLILGIAVLVDLFLLLTFTALEQIRGVAAHYLRTELADAFVLLSLLLVVASVAATESRWKLTAASALLLVSWLINEQHAAMFRDDGSRLSVLITRAADKIGFDTAGMAFAVLHKMDNYEKRGMYDAAIYAGIKWLNHNPEIFDDRISLAIACAFLNKAHQDRNHAEEYVRQALVYRDKAIPIASDTNRGWYSMSTVQDMAAISESAADISDDQRCVQYRNTIRLLQLLAGRAQDKQDEISRRFGPKQDASGVTLADVDRYKSQVEAAIARVRDKQQKSGCR